MEKSTNYFAKQTKNSSVVQKNNFDDTKDMSPKVLERQNSTTLFYLFSPFRCFLAGFQSIPNSLTFAACFFRTDRER